MGGDNQININSKSRIGDIDSGSTEKTPPLGPQLLAQADQSGCNQRANGRHVGSCGQNPYLQRPDFVQGDRNNNGRAVQQPTRLGEIPDGQTPPPPNVLGGADSPSGRLTYDEAVRKNIDPFARTTHNTTHPGPRVAEGIRYGDDTHNQTHPTVPAGGLGTDAIMAGIGYGGAKLARLSGVGKEFFKGPSVKEYAKLQDARHIAIQNMSFMQGNTPMRDGPGGISIPVPDPSGTKISTAEFRQEVQSKIAALEGSKRTASGNEIVAIDSQLKFYNKFTAPLSSGDIHTLRATRLFTDAELNALNPAVNPSAYRFTGAPGFEVGLRESSADLRGLTAPKIAAIEGLTKGLADTPLESARDNAAKLAWQKAAGFAEMPHYTEPRAQWASFIARMESTGTGGVAGPRLFDEEIRLAEINKKLAPVEKGGFMGRLAGNTWGVTKAPIIVGALNFGINEVNQNYGKQVDNALSNVGLGNAMEIITPTPLSSGAEGFALMTREPVKNLGLAALYGAESNMTTGQRWLTGGIGAIATGAYWARTGDYKPFVTNATITLAAEATSRIYDVALDKTNGKDRVASVELLKHEGNFGVSAIRSDADAYADVGKSDPHLQAKNYNRFVYYPDQSWNDAIRGRVNAQPEPFLQQAGIPQDVIDKAKTLIRPNETLMDAMPNALLGRPDRDQLAAKLDQANQAYANSMKIKEPELQRKRHQIVLSRAEGEYLMDNALSSSQTERLYNLGRGLNLIQYDPNNPVKFVGEVSERYKSVAQITEHDPAGKGHKDDWNLGVGTGLDIGGTASEAFIHSSTKSTWTQMELIKQAERDMRAKLKMSANDDLSSKVEVSFEEGSAKFTAKDSAIGNIVDKLNDDLKGLKQNKQEVNDQLNKIFAQNGADVGEGEGKGHNLEALVRTTEADFSHHGNKNLGDMAKQLGTKYENIIEGTQMLATFKATKLIPFYDGQVQFAQNQIATHPETDPMKHAQQLWNLKYYQEQAQQERLLAAKLYRDAALLNMGHAQMALDSGNNPVGAASDLMDPKGDPHGARWCLDQAKAINQQLLAQGWKPNNLSADQIRLEEMYKSLQGYLQMKTGNSNPSGRIGAG